MLKTESDVIDGRDEIGARPLSLLSGLEQTEIARLRNSNDSRREANSTAQQQQGRRQADVRLDIDIALVLPPAQMQKGLNGFYLALKQIKGPVRCPGLRFGHSGGPLPLYQPSSQPGNLMLSRPCLGYQRAIPFCRCRKVAGTTAQPPHRCERSNPLQHSDTSVQ